MDIYALIWKEKEKKELGTLLACNEKTQRFGLCLTEEQARELVICRNNSLKKYQRVEFGSGILDKLIYVFCDSPYIDGGSYAETLEKLQDVFYAFKNETQDKVTDDEILNFMKEQFDGICCGDIEYLGGTCLERFSRAVRDGYLGYEKSQGMGEYEQFSEEERWDADLYHEVLAELFW